MSFDPDTLYKLLPAVHRVQDDNLRGPLRQLIEVIAGQVAVVEESLEQLYDNSFVETAAPWALPYLADLLGIRGLSGDNARTRAPRSEIGHTIGYRRRKGTVVMLESLARDATGWQCHAVEFFQRLITTQNLNHIRPGNLAIASLRNADLLEFFDTPFESAARTVEVRRIQSLRGKWNIPNVGLFLWRLDAYPLTRSPLVHADAFPGRRHFRFHPLGFDIQLFNLPRTEPAFSQLAQAPEVPMPISRRMLKGAPPSPNALQFSPNPVYYGKEGSLVIEDSNAAPLLNDILVADLSDVTDGAGNPAWAHQNFAATQKKILLDPVLGRVLFPADLSPDDTRYGTFHYGFSAPLGGGEYNRSQLRSSPPPVARVAKNNPQFNSITNGIAAARSAGGAVEIAESDRFVEAIPPIDTGGNAIQIRAAEQRRPTLILTAPLEISGAADGSFTIDGLLISGAQIHITGNLGKLTLRHCTIVPSLQVAPNGTLTMGPAPALVVESPTTQIDIDSCIIQSMRVSPDTVVRMKNTIVDASASTSVALAGIDGVSPAASWKMVNCTIRGKVSASILQLASNSIFLADLAPADNPAIWPAPMLVKRRQEGCVRFCWLPRGARVPRRFKCIPSHHGPDLSPIFTSFQYGDAAYAQLSELCPEEIRRGADDESEMGAFHDLYQPQRLSHLRSRLKEYLRFGLDAGLFCAT
ncbi:MAG TPA: hypothetical protein VM008_07180 [Phycisphaerae bacterium]|nr:hypothetical protein [Phycisphaerae bacterium]